ncbi:MAG: hypothetical protein NC177_17650, partial [Ruminococcus flavefaciens]|nr:hypothetical protein [Ruminococcus flavefaciens]
EHSTSAYRPYAVIKYTNDTTVPTISSVSGNPTDWTKSNVTLKVTATDNVYGASGIASYSFDNGGTWQTSNSKSFSSNQTVNIKVKDLAGNISAVKTVKITKIDKTAPTISKVELSPSSWTNGSVKVTVTATDAGCGLHATAYSFDDGSTWQAANNKSYSANKTDIKVKVRDTLGNIVTYASNPVKVDKIDKTAPTVTVSYSATAVTNGDVTATITMKDDKALGKYKLGSAAEVAISGTSKTITKKYTANATENIVVYDAAGNSKTLAIKVTNIDKTKPTITIKYSTTDWTNKDVTATITIADNTALKTYKIGEDTAVSVSGASKTITKTYAENAEETITVTDTAGNTNTKVISLTKIDKIAPDIQLAYSTKNATNKNVLVFGILSDNAGLKYSQIDNNSKVDIEEAALKAIEEDPDLTEEEKAALTPPILSIPYLKYCKENLTQKITVWDYAGNSATELVEVTNIDKGLPDIEDITISTMKPTKDPVYVTLTVSDDVELDYLICTHLPEVYPLNGKKDTVEIPFYENSESLFTIYDTAGNEIEYPIYINNIDKESPQAAIEFDTAEWTNNDLKATITFTDNMGLKSYRIGNGNDISISGKTAVAELVYKTNINQTITVTDEAGLVTVYDEFIYCPNYDDEIPDIKNVSVSKLGWYNDNATITVDASDDKSGIAEFSFDGGANWSKENEIEIVENTESIIVAVKDNAGNVAYYQSGVGSVPDISSATLIPTRIDRVAPEAPDIFEEDGQVYISSRSFGFDDKTDSPEHIEYKLGESGEWTKYEEPLTLVNTYDVTVYGRVCDEAGNISEESSIVVKSRLGEYTASYTDLAIAEGVYPIGFERTYSSIDGWFFSFEANIKECTNGFVFTDFYGKKHHYLKNGEEKYVSVDGDELIFVKNKDNLVGYELTYGEIICQFNLNGKLAYVKNNYITAEYAWTSNSLTIEDKAGRVSHVYFENGKPYKILLEDRYVTVRKVVEYKWDGDNLVTFIDATNTDNEGDIIIPESIHSYKYGEFGDENNRKSLMVCNELENIDYSNEKRVKLISQPNGAFVKYTYNDTAASENEKTPENIGTVTVSDGKGVTDIWYYSDGVTITNSVSSYSDKAVYTPGNISSELESDKIANVAYVVKAVSDGSNNNSTSTENNNENQTPASDDDSSLYDKNDDGSYTFYSYDEQDRVVVTLEVKAGTLNVTKETTLDDAEAVADTKTNTVYADGSDNVKETVTLKRNAENVFENSSKETYEYNTQESIKTYTLYSGNGNGWQQNYCEEYEYNDYGNNTKKTVTVYNGQPDAETGVRESTITVTDYIYDVWNQPVETTESVYANNTASEPTSTVLTKTVYDILGRTLSVTEDGETTAYKYDRYNNVLKISSSDGVTEYNYDDGEQRENGEYEGNTLNLLSRKNPNGSKETYDYDNFGNLSYHDYNGYAFEYNTLGNISNAYIVKEDLEKNNNSENQIGDNKVIEQTIVSYTYSSDMKQDVLNANFGNGQNVDYVYNEDGELTTVKLGEETKYGYSYFDQKDENGNITKEWSELTDYVNNLKKVVEESKTTINDINGNFIYSVENVSKDEEKAGSFDGTIFNVNKFNCSYSYVTEYGDKEDSFTGNGSFTKMYEYQKDKLSHTLTHNFVKHSYGYNEENQIDHINIYAGDVRDDYIYRYDSKGNIIQENSVETIIDYKVDERKQISYNYDKDNQLVSTEQTTVVPNKGEVGEQTSVKN